MARIEKSAREKIIETALRLFYAEGIRAVGVDRIIAEAGIAKMSFYNNFKSKEQLVLAFIHKRDEMWREWFQKELAKNNKNVLSVFDILEKRFCQRDFRGCAFINTMVEIANFESEIHKAAQAHKLQVIEILKTWLYQHHEPENVSEKAYQLMLLIDGAIVTAVRDGDARSIHLAKKIAHSFLTVK